MKRVTIKSVQKLVKENNIKGLVSMEIVSSQDIYKIHSDGGVLSFDNLRTADKVFRILKHELYFETPKVSFERV